MTRICINCETTFDSITDTCPKCGNKNFWERGIENKVENEKNKKEEKEEKEENETNENEEDK